MFRDKINHRAKPETRFRERKISITSHCNFFYNDIHTRGYLSTTFTKNLNQIV